MDEPRAAAAIRRYYEIVAAAHAALIVELGHCGLTDEIAPDQRLRLLMSLPVENHALDTAAAPAA
jgi:hypothetical protein